MSYDGTIQSDFLGAIGEWISRTRSENIAPRVVTDKFPAKIDMPLNKGDELEVLRHLRYDTITERLTIGEQPTTPTLVHKSTYIKVKLQTMGDIIKIPTPEADKVALFNAAKAVKDEQNDQIQRSLDWWNIETLSKDLMPYRLDGSADHQKAGTCTSAGTTVTAISTDLTEPDDFWNRAFIMFRAQTENLGLCRQIDATTGWVLSTHTLTWGTTDTRALVKATSTSDTFIIVKSTGIDLNVSLDTAGIIRAHLRLVLNEGSPYDLITKGQNVMPQFVWICDPYVEHDLWDDDDFKKHCLSPKGDDVYTSGGFARYVGFDFCRTTRGYRETAAGVASATGDVHVSQVFGKNTFAVTRLAGYGQSPDGIVSELKKDPAPITRFWTLSWSVYRAVLVQFGLNGLAIRTGSLVAASTV